jgi:hypothetical protein
MVMQLIGKVVANLDDVGTVIPIMQNIGSTHAHFKVYFTCVFVHLTKFFLWYCPVYVGRFASDLSLDVPFAYMYTHIFQACMHTEIQTCM